MPPAQNKLWDRFIEQPPPLEPGIDFAVERFGPAHAILRFRYEGGAIELRARWLSVPYPSGLRRLVGSDSEIDAVIVERIPRGLDAAAVELGISYLDIRGAGRVAGPGFFYLVKALPIPSRAWLGGDLEREANESPKHPASSGLESQRMRRVNPFAPKASRIVRALLIEPDRHWRSSEIAAAVDVDPGNAHRVLGALVGNDLVERDEDLYAVPDPGSLLDAWAEHAPRARESVRLMSDDDLVPMIRAIAADLGEGCVVSGEWAAEQLAPYLSARSAILHCSDDAFDAFEDIARQSNPSLRSASRVEARRSEPGVAHFAAEADGVRIAAPVQVYIDLVRERGRAREAAEHLRSGVIEF